MGDEALDLSTVQGVMEDMGGECVLIGGWASYLHLSGGSLSHDVDAILDPLHDKARVVALTGASPTHLGKLSGKLRDAKVDLYVPYTSRIGGIPVESLLPYTTTVHGVKVLIPEAHLLTKAACVWDDARFTSVKGRKDAAEVRGMMSLSSPSLAVSLWASMSDHEGTASHKWGVLLKRASAHVPNSKMKRGFSSVVREWSAAASVVDSSACDEYTVDPSERVMFLPARGGVVARFHFRGSTPTTVEVLREGARVSTHTVTAGIGRELLDSARRMHPSSRAIPVSIGREYARSNGSCIACGKPLTDRVSLERGYGDTCASKFR